MAESDLIQLITDVKESLEREIRRELTEIAEAHAVKVFARNLRDILMSSPLGSKNMIALDPGFRTGCKLVCLDQQGKLLHHDVIFPTTGEGLQSCSMNCWTRRSQMMSMTNQYPDARGDLLTEAGAVEDAVMADPLRQIILLP